ncbi:protein phosphatase 1F [Periophthalmus magnuspinnatus]|uniref:protein phosphatase 1F n=1 Tax=Periophthalmus magnuspinnatus TaxID=409849 RepID=UPI002436EEB9|nr:protein phosphatase 1F [Periophthalmus magnuspinnatus]
MEEEEACSFLTRFTDEFPTALEQDTPLPANPLSPKVSLHELHGESLDLGLRLLSARGAPPLLASLLCHSAVSELLQSDLSTFHCPLEDEHHTVLLQSAPVQRLFVNELINAALRWQQNVPALPAVSRPLVSTHAIRNARRKMEDKHVVIPYFSQLFGLNDGIQRSYLAVFDGHGGVDSASFAAVHLHVTLSRQKDLTSDPESAFKQAFTQTDQMLQQRAQRERVRSGSTAVAALIQGQRLLVAWLGDSQALLVRNGTEEEIMDPHKPDREDEKRRIEDLGGCVTFMGCWRVNGTYAVSRAFGDFDQKPYVSSEADCCSLELRGDEDYLLLACDGFFDSVRPSAVPRLVLEALRNLGPEVETGPGPETGPWPEPGADSGPGLDSGPGPDPDPEQAALRVAQVLVSRAKESGSSDNITVVIMFLRSPREILRDSASSE